MLDRLAVFLEREAGHHLLSLLVIAAGALIIDPASRAQIGRDLCMIGIGYLGRSMGAQR